ncbi:hypothetical protein GCM10010174_32370 [Kutzneria viridogrisea]|uniref:Uncharacterized protein n=2 Tax=Kutzneria TaxID=43356 RepID=W5VX50_9PSEU|nr:hypothetical protein [Kutzneria albida]AHH93418.1 hypothetical protein KALB_41 [Kutzneria albida DSM 43870]MBA8929197.1 NAD(P)-dependent dehydrogenase (short-subunit alcohol dehydrogenase family) [Kutzneria viridogrisea]
MTSNQAAIAQGNYVGATTDELSRKTGADKVAAGVSQKALFQRRGDVTLYDDKLVLSQWSDSGDLELTRADIKSVKTEFTEHYGRFIGGLLNAGKPLIIDSTVQGEFYLLINRKEFMETTDDRQWEKMIKEWLNNG